MNKEILERAKNIFKNQEFQIFTGMKLEKLEDKKSIISCENKKELSQGLGYMHGGMVAAI